MGEEWTLVDELLDAAYKWGVEWGRAFEDGTRTLDTASQLESHARTVADRLRAMLQEDS